jgi:hypothetical protein
VRPKQVDSTGSRYSSISKISSKGSFEIGDMRFFCGFPFKVCCDSLHVMHICTLLLLILQFVFDEVLVFFKAVALTLAACAMSYFWRVGRIFSRSTWGLEARSARIFWSSAWPSELRDVMAARFSVFSSPGKRRT